MWWITANARLARAHVEDAEAPKLNAIALRQGPLHAFEHRIHRHFSFCLCDAGFVNEFVNKVEFDQGNLSFQICKLEQHFA
jgi:hypothetical protein